MIITLTGNNPYIINRQLSQLTKEFVKKYGDMSLEIIDCEETGIEKISESLESLPFLSVRKLVVLKEASKQKAFIDKADQQISNLPESTDLILVESKLDKRLSYYKLLKSKTDFREFKELDAINAIKWLCSEAKLLNGDMGENEAKFLVDRVGLDQLRLFNELTKLITYKKNVTNDTIKLLVEPTPQSTIFELIEAAFRHDRKRMLELYEEQRALKVEPQQIIALLSWQFHILALIKASNKRSDQTISKETGLNPYVISKSLKVADGLAYQQLKTMVKDLLQLDVDLKSKSIDADEALQQFLITISS